MTPGQIEAAARSLHRFGAPRVGNDVESWETLQPSTQARWMKMASLALEAAETAGRWEAKTPVVEVRE